MILIKNILKAWMKYTTKELTKSNILSQQIFWNMNIKMPNGKTIFYKRLKERGIFLVRDIVCNKRLLTTEQAKAEKQLNHLETMEFLSVLKCFDANIKYLISLSDETIIDPENEMISNLDRESSKNVYWQLIKNKAERPTSEEKINETFQITLDESKWEKIYCLPLNTTIEVKLRSFQIKLNHFYYFTNKKLHSIGISQTPNCTFCKREVETIAHLFIDCSHVTPLWNYFESLISEIETPIHLDRFKKLMGHYEEAENRKYIIVNHILIVLKYHIPKCRIFENIPSVTGFKRDILDKKELLLVFITKPTLI